MKFPDNFFEDEVRDGFYISGMVKRAWAAQLVLLDEFRKFCYDYDIKWFAAYGTLLGAVRHHGFIPWDDDVDVWMSRKDYEILLRNVNMMPEQITFMDGRFGMEDNTMFDQPFGRLINTESYMPHEDFLEKYKGFPYPAGIDIFVLDKLTQDDTAEQLRAATARYVMYTIQNLKNADPDENEERIKQIEEWSNVTIDREGNVFKQLMNIFEAIGCMYEETDCKYVTSMHTWLIHQAYKFESSWFDHSIELPFESTTVLVPAGYRKVLEKWHPDYMTPIQGMTHNYPFFRISEENMEEIGNPIPYNYHFNESSLIKTNTYAKKSIISKYLELMLKAYALSVDSINQMSYVEISRNFGVAQKIAYELMKILADNYPKEAGNIHAKLDEYSECLFKMMQLVKNNNLDNQKLAADLQNETFGLLIEIRDYVKKEIIEPLEIVLLPFKASGWKYLKPIYNYLCKIPNAKVIVSPIPYYHRNCIFELDEKPIYEGEDIAKDVDIVSWENMNLSVHTPELVITQNPYDQYGIGFSVDPHFYSDELRNYSRNVVYTPWFRTDEVIVQHGAAYLSAYTYIDMPGVIKADKVLVPSLNTRRIYIDNLTRFAGDGTWKRWENSVQNADSEEDYKRIFNELLQADRNKHIYQGRK